MRLKLTLERPPQRLSDAVRKMHARSRDQDAARRWRDGDDALERMLGPLGLFARAHPAQDFLAMRGEVVPTQAHVASGIRIANALAGRATHAAGRPAKRRPGPAAVAVDRAAVHAARRLAQLAAQLIAVMHHFLQELLTTQQPESLACGFHKRV